jgi:Lysine methyltransferase
MYPQDAANLLIRYQEDQEKKNCDDDVDDDPTHADASFSNVFFDFANAKRVGYIRAADDFGTSSEDILMFDQDENACGHVSGPQPGVTRNVLYPTNSTFSQHTGGIIWETAYVLLNHLLRLQNESEKRYPLGNVIELGAGVGFLGQCLALEGCCETLVLTEIDDVLIHLESTLKSNAKALRDRHITAHLLNWKTCDVDIPKLNVPTFDTILATDVIFAPDLVEPLLQTAAKISKESTVWFLCVQVRCSKSHEAFLRRAPEFGFRIDDQSNALDEWGKAVECVLLRLTRIHETMNNLHARKRPKT